MSRRRPPAHGARNSGAPVLRALAIAVAVGGIGAGTWVLGSGPDQRPVTENSQVLTVPGASADLDALDPADNAAVGKPPLSVAPAPPAAASPKRESVTRATRNGRAPGAKALHATKP